VRRSDQVSAIILEIRQAHRGLLTAIEGIAAMREEVAAADASLKGERLRLARGSSTILEVAQLEENWTAAELRLLESRTKVEQARVRLQRATGALLPGFRIELGPEDELRRTTP